MKERFKGSLLLLIGTAIWGCAFVAQSVAMDHIGPFTFQVGRSLLAVAVLVPVAAVFDGGKRDGSTYVRRWQDKKLWKTGLLCGLALFVASGLQQMGMVHTDPGKAGFLTAMYIVLVPVLGLFLKKRPGLLIWISVGLAAVGLYLLSCVGVDEINIGDVYLIGCALAYAVQITLVDRLSPGLDGVRLNCIQFFVAAVLSAVVVIFTETPTWSGVLACSGALLYTGVLSSAVGFTLQILGQQRISSEPAALIMSLESVFAVLAGWIVLRQTLTIPETIGCVLVFAAVLLSQWQPKRMKKAENDKERRTRGMIYTPLTNKAMKFAYKAHHGQVDPSGVPYIFHPIHLAEQMDDEVSCCAALLHDTVEDTEVTQEDILREFGEEVAEVVALLTHEKGGDYAEYVRAIAKHPVARKVKLADLDHNSDQTRCAGTAVTEEKLAYWREKYRKARAILTEE